MTNGSATVTGSGFSRYRAGEPITINNGVPMRAWYDIAGFDFAHRADPAGLAESMAQAEALIAREGERGIAPNRVLLAGFSQGGVIALHTGLRHAEPLAGIIALSTYLACADSLGVEASTANRNVPILMTHGRFDPVVPLTLAKVSQARLATHGYRVAWHEYPMQHAVCAEEIAAIAAFLRRVLSV